MQIHVLAWREVLISPFLLFKLKVLFNLSHNSKVLDLLDECTERQTLDPLGCSRSFASCLSGRMHETIVHEILCSLESLLKVPAIIAPPLGELLSVGVANLSEA